MIISSHNSAEAQIYLFANCVCKNMYKNPNQGHQTNTGIQAQYLLFEKVFALSQDTESQDIRV
jgi:hypothetical protein